MYRGYNPAGVLTVPVRDGRSLMPINPSVKPRANLLIGMAKADETKEKIKPTGLLAKYGIAYLITSISLATLSYVSCYALISKGVDVAALLERVGIEASAAGANAGTAAIAYAMHKAASPIRFPPTVALTPVVAKWIGKTPKPSVDQG